MEKEFCTSGFIDTDDAFSFAMNILENYKHYSEWVYNGRSVIQEIFMLIVSDLKNNERNEQGYCLYI